MEARASLSLAGYADIFYRNVQASGVIPQLSLIVGPCTGGAVYSPAMTDFVFMVDHTSHMFVTGPDVIKTVTHEDVTKEHLGGAMTHNSTSGVAHFLAADDEDCLRRIRELMRFLPQNNLDGVPEEVTKDPEDRADPQLDTLIPAESNKPYDIKDVICRVIDDEYFFEVAEHFARNIVVGFARMGGQAICLSRDRTGSRRRSSPSMVTTTDSKLGKSELGDAVPTSIFISAGTL